MTLNEHNFLRFLNFLPMKNFVNTTSVISFRYKNGTISITDTNGAYGRVSMFKNLTRTFAITPTCLISCSGEYSDIQHLHKLLKYEMLKDKRTIYPKGIHKMIQSLLYHKRSRLEPLNVFCTVSGIENNKHFLGAVNHLGNFFESDVICSGLGAYLITPFLREKIQGRIDEIEREEAIKIAKEAALIGIYRDCLTINNIQIGYVEDGCCEVLEPIKLDTNWDLGIIPLD